MQLDELVATREWSPGVSDKMVELYSKWIGSVCWVLKLGGSEPAESTCSAKQEIQAIPSTDVEMLLRILAEDASAEGFPSISKAYKISQELRIFPAWPWYCLIPLCRIAVEWYILSLVQLLWWIVSFYFLPETWQIRLPPQLLSQAPEAAECDWPACLGTSTAYLL